MDMISHAKYDEKLLKKRLRRELKWISQTKGNYNSLAKG